MLLSPSRHCEACFLQAVAISLIIVLCSYFSAHRRRGGSFFWLGPKETKTQGLELLSDKFVKALLSAAQAPDEKSGNVRCLGFCWHLSFCTSFNVFSFQQFLCQ